MIKYEREGQRRADEQECPICTNSYRNQYFIEFSPACRHSFCESCTRQHITSQLQIFKAIDCLHSGCEEWVKEDSKIFKQELTLQEKKKYYKFLIRQKVNRCDNQRHCPNENCEGFIITDQKPTICVLCQTEFCLECMAPKHMGTCEVYGAQIIAENIQVQRCKSCKMFVQRIKGCNHMTCLCGNQFCYICGDKFENYSHICNPTARNNRLAPQRISPNATQPSAAAPRTDHQVIPSRALVEPLFILVQSDQKSKKIKKKPKKRF